jgi:hypothetical protein
MPMHMGSYSGCGRVGANVKTCLVKSEASSDFLDGLNHRNEQSPIQGGRVQDRGDVLFGDDHYMDIRMRVGVVKCQYQLILPNLIHLNLSRENVFAIPVAPCQGLVHSRLN